MPAFFTPFIPAYFHLWHLPVIFLAGLIGEGYATVIGGGSVLVQFVLAGLGMPMSSVIATDLAGCMGGSAGVIITSTSLQELWNRKRLLLQLAIPHFLGGIVGTFFLIHISGNVLKYILIVALPLLLLRVYMGKKTMLLTLEELHIDRRQHPLVFIVLFVLGIYGNISGVGAGTFIRLAFVSLLRMSVTDSISIVNIIIMPACLFSLIATAWAGLIVWPYCLTLWLGTFIGGRYAYKFALKIPDRYLRGLLAVIVSLYLVWLLASLSGWNF